jgi:hypothetical protein
LVLTILLYHLILVQGLRVIPSEVVLRVSDSLLEMVVVAVIAHVVRIVLRGKVIRVPVDGGAVGSTLEQHLVDEVLPIAELLRRGNALEMLGGALALHLLSVAIQLIIRKHLQLV